MKSFISIRAGRSIVIACISLFVLGIFVSLPVVFGSSSNPPYTAQGFNVLSTVWGTSTNHGEAGPGDTYVPLTVTFQYLYPTSTAISTSATLDTLGTGFTPANGGPNETVYYYSSLTPGSIFTLTFYLDLNSSLKVDNHYSLPLTMLWNAILSNSSLEPETSLTQTISLSVPVYGDAHLTFKTSSMDLIPGQVNDLNLTIVNNGSGYASSISTLLSPSQQVGVQNLIPEIQNLTAGSSKTFPLQIYVPQTASGSVIALSIAASYRNAYGNNASTSQVLDFHASAANDARLIFSAEKITLTPGETNNITVTLTNMGSGNATGIVTTTTGSAQATSTLVHFPTVTVLTPGTSYSANVSVYVTSSAAGQALTLTFSATYLDQYGTAGSASGDAGFQVASSPSISANTFSVSSIADTVVSGTVSKVSFSIKNIGSATIFSPEYAISVTQPVVIASNSSFSSSGTSIASGSSQVFAADLTASPSSTSGIYPATIEISFTDRYGTTHNQSYSVAIMLSGSIDLVVQSEAFTQNATGITVTGNLLNEGAASAYYASVFGYMNNSKTGTSPDYVGQIDPNSPVPFTISIPYRAGTTSTMANVTVAVLFRNSLGQSQNFSTSSMTPLKSFSQIISSDSPISSNSGTAQGNGLNLLELAIIFTVGLVAAGVGIFALVRRNNRRTPRSPVSESPKSMPAIS